MKSQRVIFQFSIGLNRREEQQPPEAADSHRVPAASRQAPTYRSSSTCSGTGTELHRGSEPKRSPYSLLITDDDDAFRETLRSIFEPEGFHTLLAQSGEEALDILREERVHLALLDQHLPKLSGLETLRIIRQVNVILPVILLTAENTQQLLREALAAHAFCVMSKPVTRSVVVYTVQQALSRYYDPARKVLGGEESESTI